MPTWSELFSSPLESAVTIPTTASSPPQVRASAASLADAEARRLSAAVGRGDEPAFQELYDRYHHRLFRLALVLGQGDETLATETVQASFLIAAAKLREVESEAHLWNWLARVARQQLARTRRQQSWPPAVVSMDPLPETSQCRDTELQLEQQLDAALAELGAEERQLVEWFYFDGRTQKELAEQLGSTPKAVSARLERARAKLRVLLHRRHHAS